MKHTIVKTAAALSLAAAATLAIPAAASASTYPPSGASYISDTSVAPGGVVSFGVEPGVFQPGEAVSVTLTGENATGARLGLVKFVVDSQTVERTAEADGSLAPLDITLPANASGTYTVTAYSASVPGGVTQVFAVPAAAGGSGLAVTGMDSNALLGVWVGGGALVLAGGAVAVGAAVYRQRKQAV